jgi:hypothetical protein
MRTADRLALRTGSLGSSHVFSGVHMQNAISQLMVKHGLGRVEDLLNSPLLDSLPLTTRDLSFLHDMRRCTAETLEDALLWMEEQEKGKQSFRDAWSKIGSAGPRLEGDSAPE